MRGQRYTPGKTVELPAAPKNRSPVPWLTSIHSTVSRGPYGDAGYRGNCSGYIIKDLLEYFGATRVLDPMAGSGTCKDVCSELGISCRSVDLKSGKDATKQTSYRGLGKYDFIWLHPPYWRMIPYSDSPRCLSNAETPEDFEDQLCCVLRNCTKVLTATGHIAILMGDYFDREYGFISLTYRTKLAAENAGLSQCCTDIVRFQHNNSSSEKTYKSAFIPGLHDLCMVFETE